MKEKETIKIFIHNQEREITPNTTISVLLKDLGIEKRTMAAAVNMEVVKKEEWERYTFVEGDRVEFLHFVGGG